MESFIWTRIIMWSEGRRQRTLSFCASSLELKISFLLGLCWVPGLCVNRESNNGLFKHGFHQIHHIHSQLSNLQRARGRTEKLLVPLQVHLKKSQDVKSLESIWAFPYAEREDKSKKGYNSKSQSRGRCLLNSARNVSSLWSWLCQASFPDSRVSIPL